MRQPEMITAMAVIFLFSGIALAQLRISGPQSGILGPGTYLVEGDISIPAGQTLNIEAGANFLHSDRYAWSVFGQLRALGTDFDSILFTALFPDTGYWGGIHFRPGASDSSLLEYCVIEHSLHYDDSSGAGLTSDSVDITLRHSRISNCRNMVGGGLYVQYASVIMEYCLITNNVAGCEGGGMVVFACPQVLISHSIIAADSVGYD